MSNYFFYPVTELKGYIILSLVVLCVLTFLFIAVLGRKKNGLAAFGLQKLFLGRTVREVFYMTFGISELIFILPMFIFQTNFDVVQIITLGILVSLRVLCSPGFGAMLMELIIGVLMAVSLVIGNLLQAFMTETGFDLYIFVIWLLLSMFVFIYSVYHYIKTLGKMVQHHENSKRADDKEEDDEDEEE